LGRSELNWLSSFWSTGYDAEFSFPINQESRADLTPFLFRQRFVRRGGGLSPPAVTWILRRRLDLP
jgi:hypothetical protein